MKPLVLTCLDTDDFNHSVFLHGLDREGFSYELLMNEERPRTAFTRVPYAALIIFKRFNYERLDRALKQAAESLRTTGGKPDRIIACGPSIPAKEERDLRRWGASKVIQPSAWQAKEILDRVLAALFGGFADVAATPQSGSGSQQEGPPTYIECKVPYKGKTQTRKIIGATNLMQEVFAEIKFYSNSPETILITGESGTGKELVAAAIHSVKSANENRRYVTINIAEISEELLPNELFGHSRGAFTGAGEERKGLLAEAGNGTVFIDEIGDLDLENQARLLRVLTNREIRPVGAEHERRVPFDARLIFATHQSLEARCARRKFRMDLYWRITEGHTIRLRPLRERKGDLELLAKEFFNEWFEERRDQPNIFRLGQGDYDKIIDLCVTQNFPGNLRSLRGVLNGCFNRSLKEDRQFNIQQLITEMEIERVLSQQSIQTGDSSEAMCAVAFDSSKESLETFRERALREYCSAVFKTSNKDIALALEVAKTSKKTFYKYLPKSDLRRKRTIKNDPQDEV